MLRAILLLLAIGLALPAAALEALRGPGVILLMRHATAPGTGDPPGFRLGVCATQRNLSEAGRAEARATGARLRAAGIGVTLVASSRWCRARETAELLALGPVEGWPELDSFFSDRAEGPARTEALLARLAALPEGARPILVTHQVNITALTGVVPRSGEIVAVRLGEGGVEVVVRVGVE